MTIEDEEIFYKLIKASAQQGVKQGAMQVGIPYDLSRFLANQLSFTFDLLKRGYNLTPGYLGILLAKKGLGIINLALGQRSDCAIAVMVLGISLTKSSFFTTFTGLGHFAINAVELLAECYSVDQSCGVSDKVKKQVEKVTLPAAMWLEMGILQWLSRGG